MIKKIVLGIVAFIALLLVIALFVSKEYTVEREITINRPKQEVFSYIKIQMNQEHFNKWWMADPAMKKDLRGTDGIPGFTIAWESNNDKVGKGEQEIKSILEGESVGCEIRFEKPFAGIANTIMATTAVTEQQTKVKWTFSGKSKYPMNFMNLFVDKMLGGDLQKSLDNLKGILEK